MNMDTYILEAIDKPVKENDIRIWADWYCHAPEEWKTVRRTRVNKHTEVVTVYTGKDAIMHEPGSPPLLWRTDLYEDDACETIWSYPTRADAEAGHPRAVANVRYRLGEETTVQLMQERRNKTLLGRVRRKVTSLYIAAQRRLQ